MSTKTENFSSKLIADGIKRGTKFLNRIAYIAVRSYYKYFLLGRGNKTSFRDLTCLTIVSIKKDKIGGVFTIIAKDLNGQFVKFTVTAKVDSVELVENTTVH